MPDIPNPPHGLVVALTSLRGEAGLSVAELAQSTGVSAKRLGEIESGAEDRLQLVQAHARRLGRAIRIGTEGRTIVPESPRTGELEDLGVSREAYLDASSRAQLYNWLQLGETQVNLRLRDLPASVELSLLLPADEQVRTAATSFTHTRAAPTGIRAVRTASAGSHPPVFGDRGDRHARPPGRESGCSWR